ncbi:hypothetical protein BDZ45DRAFT_682715 [Acephala macrosclerotiorum]|nr:hypothetical protein BDZ45DRAFT_682715 [Acephala macrosclerotiorum]
MGNEASREYTAVTSVEEQPKVQSRKLERFADEMDDEYESRREDLDDIIEELFEESYPSRHWILDYQYYGRKQRMEKLKRQGLIGAEKEKRYDTYEGAVHIAVVNGALDETEHELSPKDEPCNDEDSPIIIPDDRSIVTLADMESTGTSELWPR